MTSTPGEPSPRDVLGRPRGPEEEETTTTTASPGEPESAFLLALSDALRPLGRVERIRDEAARRLDQHLGVRCQFHALHGPEEGHHGAGVEPAEEAPAGSRLRVEDLGRTVADELRAGHAVVVPDAARAPGDPGAWWAALVATGAGAIVLVPGVTSGRLAEVLSVSAPGPRAWTVGDVRLIEETARRSRAEVERARAEQRLRATERRLDLALTAARMGIWTLDVRTGLHTRDAHLNRLLGQPPAETTRPFADFLSHMHPDDRGACAAAFDASIHQGVTLNVEFRVVWPDGTVRWLRDQGDVFQDSGGVHMAGACVDVTERREAEEAVRESEERLRLIVRSATDYAIYTLTPDRIVTSWSPGAVATFGHAASTRSTGPGARGARRTRGGTCARTAAASTPRA
ncbi:MAG: hypothetical protein EOO75_07595 [Myxococcales bacterium]|nr:MAG: hypothetical protein EOO75_07595 [Myxococcales bacterium]